LPRLPVLYQYDGGLGCDHQGGSMKRALFGLILAASVPAAAWAECYTVFQRGAIVYRSEATPIDLSGPIHTGLQKRFPGGQLIISGDDKNCTYIDPSSPVDPLTGAAVAPGAGGTLSVVAGPLETMTTNPVTAGAPVPAPQAAAVDEGCRRGGTMTRRGEPCPTTEVVGQRVIGAEAAPAAPATPVERARPIMRR
jgi:hypothetical protein